MLQDHRRSLFGTLALLGMSLLLPLSACGGGSPGPKGADLEASADSGARNTPRPEVAVRGGAGSAIFWTENGGDVVTAEFDSRREQAGARITWPQNGRSTLRIDDLESRRFALLVERDPTRIDCLVHDRDGDFLRGFAILQTATDIVYAEIVQSAAFVGQLTGQLDLGSQTGSFALVADALADLGPRFAVPSAIIAVAAAASLPAAPGNSPLVLRTLRLCAIGMLPILLGSDWRDMAGGAAVLWLLAALRGETIVDIAAANFTHGDATMQEHLDHAMRQIVDPASPAIGDFWVEWSMSILDGLPFRDDVLEGARAEFALRPTPLPTLGNLQLPTVFTLPVGGPMRVPVAVAGQCVLQNGFVYVLAGTVDQNGALSCSGPRAGGSLADVLVLIGLIDANGFTGTCDLNGTPGLCSGTQLAFGNCNAAQGSGGQGAFTFAHYVGNGTGTTTFVYQAYTIPDRFVVRTALGERFSTGGLVSGGATVTLQLNNEPIVFVSVSAPNNGTQWDYTLSCLQ
ncbi:MAG: hypothetical protein MUC36_09685 [Planctomycetes bacterium]|jgi:hypothetical protein|nr:hypothetical protein [Planctomycetota bacterium]